KVEAGETGRKAGKGLYDYDDKGKPKRSTDMISPSPALADRMILPMLNSCVACLREKVVADADTLDGAMIFATGFAPFTGGPINYARQRGVGEIVAALAEHAQKHGARFAPDEGWADIG